MNNTEDRAVKSVVIDPGHGGSDAGAVGNNMLEKDYNLLIEIDTNLLILSNLVRVLYKRKYITIKNYKAFSTKVTEISKMVGGYYKKHQDQISK